MIIEAWSRVTWSKVCGNKQRYLTANVQWWTVKLDHSNILIVFDDIDSGVRQGPVCCLPEPLTLWTCMPKLEEKFDYESIESYASIKGLRSQSMWWDRISI